MDTNQLETLYGKMRTNKKTIIQFKNQIFLLGEELERVKKQKYPDVEMKIQAIKSLDMYTEKISTYKRDIQGLELENKYLYNIYRGRTHISENPNSYKPIPLEMEDLMIVLSYLIIDFKLNKEIIQKLVLHINKVHPESKVRWMKELNQYVLNELAQESLIKTKKRIDQNASC